MSPKPLGAAPSAAGARGRDGVVPPAIGEHDERGDGPGPTVRWPSAPDRRDGVLAAIVLAVALVFHVGLESEAAAATSGWPGAVVLVLMAATLLLRHRAPTACVATAGGLTSVYYLGGAESPAATVVFLFALYAVAAFSQDRVEGIVSLGISVGAMTATFVLEEGVAIVLTANWLLSLFTFVVAWALGDNARTQVLLAEQYRVRAAQGGALRRSEEAAVADAERRRIARELHDIISHTVAVVVVQAGAAQRVLDDDPDAAREALASIETTSRDAMGELRRMLGVLRDGEDGPGLGVVPTGLASVRSLVAALRDAGLPVALDGDVDTPLPPGTALGVQRVVQEGLTNVLRHATDVQEVVVALRRDGGAVVVEVRDDGRGGGSGAGVGSGAGAGLVGLAERIALHGGTVAAGPRTDGPGFRVRATLPAGRP